MHYIHRNPVPKVVRNVQQLASYPYTGHSAIVGDVPREWHDLAGLLARFGETEVEARRRYQVFMRSTLRLGARDLDKWCASQESDGAPCCVQLSK